MMDDQTRPREQDEGGCPKRVWVMTTLSDDDAPGSVEELPPGLQFHLSRCEPCRALAERLLAVSGTLQSLSLLEPDSEVRERADAQALTALREGARLTGRVSIPDEPEVMPSARTGVPWLRYGRYAAAAAIVLAVGLVVPKLIGPRSLPRVTSSGPVEVPPAPIDHGSQQASADDDRTEPTGEAQTQAAPGSEPDEVLAGAASETSRPTVCRHRSPIEAAMCDKPHVLHRVVTLPAQRTPHGRTPPSIGDSLEGSMQAIDKSGSSGSTGRRQGDK
jgi:hypothetical protein